MPAGVTPALPQFGQRVPARPVHRAAGDTRHGAVLTAQGRGSPRPELAVPMPLRTDGDPAPLVVVPSTHPHHPGFAYTRDGHAHGGAGLVSYASDGEHAAAILSALVAHPSAQLEAGSRHEVIVEGEPLQLRLDACAPASAARHVLLRRHPDRPADYLQVHVVADRHRSYDVDSCSCCPDLARTGVLWREPFEVLAGEDEHEPLVTLLGADRGQTVTVDLPVRQLGHDLGRLERLAATPVGGGRVRLLQAPVLADWATAGAELAVDADGGWQQADAGHHVHLALRLVRSGLVIEHLDAVRVATQRLAALPGAAVTDTGGWLAVAVPPASSQRARSLLRRLVRDGHATEVGTFHDPAPQPERCSSCASGRPCR